ncbi:MAG: Eco57I restriction-modification methylase domain-containing protein [Phycisphaerae bacterium]|nr:Eco57I restriction-modification methylase domain-containing protein [Phycisphaerae bacterium]
MSRTVDAQVLAAPQDDTVLLSVPEDSRSRFFATADPHQQKSLGQFFTPPHVADLMAGMFTLHPKTVRLLDPGAGMGMLSAAAVRRLLLRQSPPRRIEVTAFEVDKALLPSLRKTYEVCRAACEQAGTDFMATVRNEDFIAEGAQMVRNDLFSCSPVSFDAAIVNPPYGKLSTTSARYRMLRGVSAETTNLYTAFLNLVIELLREDGELVAITPRSFCNGPYFKPFRQRLLERMSIRRIHVFESRTAAFRHDDVLQENIIFHAVKQTRTGQPIEVSQSAGEAGARIETRSFPSAEIVSPIDQESFIHLPTSQQHLQARSDISRLSASLATLGLQVSTGRVVDFRARQHIHQNAGPGTCPLIYPCHFKGLFVAWPKEPSRKPNAICDSSETQNLLVSAGIYVLTKRFTSKEERRRVVACIYDPGRIKGQNVGFENHLNYFHESGAGLEMPLAKGLWAYLNSSVLDLYFRQFNGHTQVNATDLRNVRFPTKEQLRSIGSRIGDVTPDQDAIDAIVTQELNE